MARAEDIVVVDRIHIHETARRLRRGGIRRGRLRGRWTWERGRRSRILELNLTRSFDEVTDEDFGVTVYGCYDGGREGLRKCLVGNLVSGKLFNFVIDGWEWSFTLRTVSFFSLTRRNVSWRSFCSASKASTRTLEEG